MSSAVNAQVKTMILPLSESINHQQGLEPCESFSHPQLTADRNERKKHAGRKLGERGGKRVTSIYYTHMCNYQRTNLVHEPVKFKKNKKKDAKVSK